MHGCQRLVHPSKQFWNWFYGMAFGAFICSNVNKHLSRNDTGLHATGRAICDSVCLTKVTPLTFKSDRSDSSTYLKTCGNLQADHHSHSYHVSSMLVILEFIDNPIRVSSIVALTLCFKLTLNLLMTTIVAPPSNASKWQMGFNSAFKGLILPFKYPFFSFLKCLLLLYYYIKFRLFLGRAF